MQLMIDFPYILIVLVLSFMTYLEGVHRDECFYKISILLVFLFIALRAPVVGADTWNYVHFFTGDQAYYNVGDSRDLEPLFLLYNSILRIFLIRNGTLYIIANTFFTLYFVKRLIDKFSLYKTFSVLCFFILFSFLNYFIALRQILGFSILLFAIIYVQENKANKWFVYIACSVISYLFHTTMFIYAIVIAGLYFINMKKITYVLMIGGSFLVGVILKSYGIDQILEFFLNAELGATERLDGYLDDKWTNDAMSLQSIIRPSMIGLVILSFVDAQRVKHWFIKIYMISVVFNNFLFEFAMIHRFNFVFSIFVIVVITWVFPRNLIFDRVYHLRKLVFLLFFLFFLRSFIIINMNADIEAEDNMHPYVMLWDDYSKHKGLPK